MKQKPPGKLRSIKGHQLNPTFILVILPHKSHRTTIKTLNPRIRNSHPMGITAQITNHMPRGLKRPLTKNNPILIIQTTNQIKEINLIS